MNESSASQLNLSQKSVGDQSIKTIKEIPVSNEEVCKIMKDWENLDSSDTEIHPVDCRSDNLLTEIVNDFDIAVEHEESIMAHSDSGHDENSSDCNILETCDKDVISEEVAPLGLKTTTSILKKKSSNDKDDDDVELVAMENLPRNICLKSDNEEDYAYDSEPDIDRLFEKYSKKKSYNETYLIPVKNTGLDHKKETATSTAKRVRFSLENNTVRTIDYESPIKIHRLYVRNDDPEESIRTDESISTVEPVETTKVSKLQKEEDKIKNQGKLEPPKKRDPKRIDLIVENLKNKNSQKNQLEALTERTSKENSENGENIDSTVECSEISTNLDKPQVVEEFFPDISLNQEYEVKPTKTNAESDCQDNIFPYIQENTKNNSLLQIVPSENEIEIESSVELLDGTKPTTATCEITDNLIAVMLSEQNRSSKTGFIFFKGSDHNYHSVSDPLLGGECDTSESDQSSDNKEIVGPELENVLVSDTILPYLTDNHLTQESPEDGGADFQLLELIDTTLARESSPPLPQTINCDTIYHSNLKQGALEFSESSGSNNIEFSKANSEVFVNHFQQQTMSVENMSELMNVVLTSIQNLNNMTKAPNIQQDPECKELFLSSDLDFNVDVIEQSQPQNLDLICDFSQTQESNCDSSVANNSITDYPNFHYLGITYDAVPTTENFSKKKVIVEHIPQFVEETVKEMPQLDCIVEKASEVKSSPRAKAKLQLLNLSKQKSLSPPKKQLNNIGFVRNSSKTRPSAPKPKKLNEVKVKETEGNETENSIKSNSQSENSTIKSTPSCSSAGLPKEKSLPIIDDFVLSENSKKETPKNIETSSETPTATPTEVEDDSGKVLPKSPALSKSPRTPKQSECELLNFSVQSDMIDNVKRRKRKPVDYSSIEKLLESDDYDYRKVQKNKGKKDEKLKVKPKEEDVSKLRNKSKPVVDEEVLNTNATVPTGPKTKSSIFEDSDDEIPKKKRSKPEPRLEPEEMNAIFDELVKEGNVNNVNKYGIPTKISQEPSKPIFALDSNLQKKLETTPVKKIGVVNPIPRQNNNVRKELPNRNSYSSEENRGSSQYYPYYDRNRRSYPYSSRESSRSSHQGNSRRIDYPIHSNDQRYSSQRSSSGSSRSSRSSRHHSTSRSSAEQRNYWYGSTSDLAWREDMKKKFPHMFKDEVYF